MRIDRLTPTKTILRELGKRLANVRKQQGLSQENLAAAAGVGVATLRRIEDGRDGKLGSWLRLLMALQMEDAVDGLVPEDFRSPLAEVKGRRRTKPQGDGFVWGDERP
ncbi:MAG: helix-turn-helix domain-containing protein [Planctomycetes bacterium]|nr:helix-turn-helix domain-containing protein [Planctomycetota bacterium]